MAVPDDGTVVGRALAITDAVAAAGVMSLARLARSTGLPKPTVHRIAHDLVARRVLRLDDDGYRLGTHLARLGATALAATWPTETAMPTVQELHERTRAMTFLLAVQDLQLVTVGVAVAPAHAAELRRRGGWPAVATLASADLFTAAGRVVLAGRGDVVDRIVAAGLRTRTPHSVRSRAALARELDRALDAGFAVEQDEHSVGWSCLAAAVHGADGGVVGVVGVCGRSRDIQVAQARWALAAADGLSRALPPSADRRPRYRAGSPPPTERTPE